MLAFSVPELTTLKLLPSSAYDGNSHKRWGIVRKLGSHLQGYSQGIICLIKIQALEEQGAA